MWGGDREGEAVVSGGWLGMGGQEGVVRGREKRTIGDGDWSNTSVTAPSTRRRCYWWFWGNSRHCLRLRPVILDLRPREVETDSWSCPGDAARTFLRRQIVRGQFFTLINK